MNLVFAYDTEYNFEKLIIRRKDLNKIFDVINQPKIFKG